MQIYSPGYRNAYDVVFTDAGPALHLRQRSEHRLGRSAARLHVGRHVPKGTGPFDQGAGDYCTNEFNESDSNGHGDPLHFVDGPGYYGGHPTPIRAFPELSRVIVYENSGGWIETGNYNFYDLLPPGLDRSADFPDNPIECEYSANDPGEVHRHHQCVDQRHHRVHRLQLRRRAPGQHPDGVVQRQHLQLRS